MHEPCLLSFRGHACISVYVLTRKSSPQDLASTNGTKVNGQFLKADEGAPANASGKRRSHPRQLKVDDTIRIGLTTLAVKLGSVERQENASQAAGRLQDSVNNGQGAGEGGVEGAAGGTPLQGAAAAS